MKINGSKNLFRSEDGSFSKKAKPVRKWLCVFFSLELPKHCINKYVPPKTAACISVRLYNLALHIPLGVEEGNVCLKCKGETFERVSIFKKGGKMLMLMQYHCSPLKGFKTGQGPTSGSTSSCSPAGRGCCRVFESIWDEVRLSSPDSSLSARGLPGFLLLDWHAVCLALAASALLHWMSQFLIDVFSKALLVQSLPVLVFFREITNCSAKSISELQTLGRTRPPKHLQGT